MAIQPIGYDAAGTMPKLSFDRLDSVRSKEQSPKAANVDAPKGAKAPTFAEMLKDVVEAERTAETAAHDYSVGRSQDLHGTMVTLQKADISFRLLATVRNKVLDAYREIMRMG